jgi:hypothetical protein
MVITQQESGTYTFTNRGIEYTIIDDSHLYGEGMFCVYTNRLNHGSHGTPPRLITLDQMLSGSNKTLRGFAQIISA